MKMGFILRWKDNLVSVMLAVTAFNSGSIYFCSDVPYCGSLLLHTMSTEVLVWWNCFQQELTWKPEVIRGHHLGNVPGIFFRKGTVQHTSRSVALTSFASTKAVASLSLKEYEARYVRELVGEKIADKEEKLITLKNITCFCLGMIWSLWHHL